MTRVALILLALVAGIASAATLAAVIGAFADPTSSLFAVVGSMVWTTLGPFLFLATCASVLAGIVLRRAGLPRMGGLVLVLALSATLGAGVILGRITTAALAAGAEIDLRAAFMLGDMETPAPDRVETVQTIDGTDLQAAIYLPPAQPDPAPVIVYIHGGGFMTGSKTETAADLRWFADRGWLVLSVDYRLFAPDSPTWDKAPQDVACALVWAAQNAARLGGDPARIALLGDSAGGNLAINLGFAASAGTLSPVCGGEIPVPRAIAVQYPAVDPESIYTDGFPIPGFAPRMLIEGYIGGSPAQYPDRIAAVASASFLTPSAPPTLIILPEKDSLVVALGTLAFVEQALAAGVAITLVRLPFANHIYNQMAANALGNQIGRSLRLQFLDQHIR